MYSRPVASIAGAGSPHDASPSRVLGMSSRVCHVLPPSVEVYVRVKLNPARLFEAARSTFGSLGSIATSTSA
jgi:hypothetical protein